MIVTGDDLSSEEINCSNVKALVAFDVVVAVKKLILTAGGVGLLHYNAFWLPKIQKHSTSFPNERSRFLF